MMSPQISILMPAYNVATFIAVAIDSVLAQSFTEFELLIINDGSTDETEEIIRSVKDDRIRFFCQQNKGIANALNRGLQLARAGLIARFDADDICYPNRLAKQYQFMSANLQYVIAGAAADYVDEKGNYVFTNYPLAYSDAEIRSIARHKCPFIHSSVIYRKAAALKYGGYNELAHSFEDHLLWQTVLKEGKGINIPEPLIQVRLNPGSITVDERWRPKIFHAIKNKVIEENSITAEQGEELLQIIQSQNNGKLKESAYHSLLAKKFLWNNYQPGRARENLIKVIAKNRLHWPSYCYYGLSYLPQKFLKNLYRLLKTRPVYLTNKTGGHGFE